MNNMKHVDTVIVGGGITGCATAYYLRKYGVHSCIVERDGIASHASGYAYGGLYPVSGDGIPGPLTELAQHGFDLHRAINQDCLERGLSIDYLVRPNVSLAMTEQSARVLKAHVEWVAQHSQFTADWRSAYELLDIDPRISRDTFGGGVFNGAAEVSAYKLTNALANLALVDVVHAAVVGVKLDSERVIAVSLSSGDVMHCDHLVLTMGPWACDASNWLGGVVPISPLKGEILRLKLNQAALHGSFGFAGNYGTSKPDGLLWVGTTESSEGYDESPTSRAREHITEQLTRMLPGIEGFEVAKQTACLRPMTPDGLPVVGPYPFTDNVYIGTGGGRKGILLGPAIGLILADLVTGKQDESSIQSFDLNRF